MHRFLLPKMHCFLFIVFLEAYCWSHPLDQQIIEPEIQCKGYLFHIFPTSDEWGLYKYLESDMEFNTYFVSEQKLSLYICRLISTNFGQTINISFYISKYLYPKYKPEKT